MSGLDGPDVRAGRPDVRAGLGRFEMHSVMEGWISKDMGRMSSHCSSWLFFLHFHAHLDLVLGLSMVSSGVPEYAQGLRLK